MSGNVGPPLEVKVWGDYALFTRPEFGVERVSYEVMTPSAARGILEAIFWKPEFDWRVREICVLRPIRHFSIVRNEISSRQSERSARSWTQPGDGYYADEDRTQRHALTLRDVAYVIRADVETRPDADAHPAKYRDQFRRRVARGQCFHQPYLGTREFSASFGPPEANDTPIEYSDDLGLMLFDLEYAENPSGPLTYLRHAPDGVTPATGTARPRLFQARLERGVLRVPPELYGVAS